MTDQEKDPQNKPAGKGRPTPTRREREKANFKPIVGDRSKEARAAARAKSTEANRKARQAMMAGDERYLLSRDKGPQRKIARDFLDSKITFIELLMPIMVVFLFVSSIEERSFRELLANIMFGAIIIAFLEVTIMNFFAVRQIKAKLGSDTKIQRGTWWYMLMRGLQPRPMRIPKPAKLFNKKK